MFITKYWLVPKGVTIRSHFGNLLVVPFPFGGQGFMFEYMLKISLPSLHIGQEGIIVHRRTSHSSHKSTKNNDMLYGNDYLTRNERNINKTQLETYCHEDMQIGTESE